MIKNNYGELTLVWKEIRKFNIQQSINIVMNLSPDVEEAKIDDISAQTVPKLIAEVNKVLRISESVLNKLVKTVLKQK